MAGLISTGIWGFICSATMKAGKITATFISGATGWIIKNNGDAEFKSIYARDKIVTNEYVYNRIRVSEDEEVIASNGKILASFLNDDGSYNVQLDLREGDMNPFDTNDLIQGYYHSPGNTTAIYAVQKMTVVEVLDDQTMTVVCLSESYPHKYMVIVRVGNTDNPDRQSFIRISSRTNCQYFYDEITSFTDLDNPDKVKCAIGKVDVGLIPSWAAKAIGGIKRWFGLVADGVILRGTFILKNDKTIEDELEGVGKTITEVETRFEIREGQISSKVEETKKYAESAAGSASSASSSANSAADSAAASESSKVVSVSKASEAKQTAEGFTQTVTEKIEIVENAANAAEGSASAAAGSASAAADSAASSEAAKIISVSKASEAKQTAEGFTQTVTEVTKKAVSDAVGGAGEVIEEKVSTAVTQSARTWKVEVMGADADGNPNKILAAINASKEGIKIDGDKVEITGTLLAQIILATGLNIGNKFIVNEAGEVSVCGKILTSEGGTRIEIDPATNSLKMYNDKDLLVGDLSFMSSEFGTLPKFELMKYGASNTLLASSLVSADSIVITNYPADPRLDSNVYSCVLNPSGGLSFQKNNEAGAVYHRSNESIWITKTSDVISIHKGDIVMFNFPSWVKYNMLNAATNNGRKFYAKNIGNDFELSGTFRGANTANISSMVDFKWGMSFIFISDGTAWNVFFCS